MANQPKTPSSSLYTAGQPDPDVGLEKDPPAPATSDLDELRQQLAELARSQQATTERNKQLESELKENQRLVEQIMQNGSSIDLVALEHKWRNREAARRKIYAQVAGKKVVLIIHREKELNRNFPVHVNLNGKFYNIPRGVPFEIEGEYLEVLDHAMVQTLAREVDLDGVPHTQVYDLFSYPYQVIRGLEGCEQSDIIAAAA